MDNIQKRWTPYTNAISALGAKKLDFIFRERILVVLTYCPSEIFVHCPQYLRVNKTRHEYALRSLHEQDGDRERFFLALFGLAGDSSPCFRKTGHRPFSKGICQMKDIKKACRAHSLAFTFLNISRKSERSDVRAIRCPRDQTIAQADCATIQILARFWDKFRDRFWNKSLSQPLAGRYWKIRQHVAREHLTSPCQGAFHV